MYIVLVTPTSWNTFTHRQVTFPYWGIASHTNCIGPFKTKGEAERTAENYLCRGRYDLCRADSYENYYRDVIGNESIFTRALITRVGGNLQKAVVQLLATLRAMRGPTQRYLPQGDDSSFLKAFFVTSWEIRPTAPRPMRLFRTAWRQKVVQVILLQVPETLERRP